MEINLNDHFTAFYLILITTSKSWLIYIGLRGMWAATAQSV
jgi:hypothetical protein